MALVLALDQGTTSSRALLFNELAQPIATAQKEIQQFYPQPGWIEHDASEIWNTTLNTAKEVLATNPHTSTNITGIGITNQRESIMLWNRSTGEPLYHTIVWQDRRTANHIANLLKQDLEPEIHQRTGLVLDPYFSATKLAWLLNHVPNAKKLAANGKLAAGTMDSWLVFNLTKGKHHVTDISNASRTMLLNLTTGDWDPYLLDLFDIPHEILPKIVPTSSEIAETDPSIFGKSIPIQGMIGDQQAALFGQMCHKPGMAKCTYGTGCFLLIFTGNQPVFNNHRLIATIAWQFDKQPPTFAQEGSLFIGGAANQWLRDGLQMIPSAPSINDLAASVPSSDGVVFVPALAGLGAPDWDPNARGSLYGITRGTTKAHIARATLEAIAYQVTSLAETMQNDSAISLPILRVDGGAATSDLLMQIQADQLGIPVDRPQNTESTALGAALMAGLSAKIWPNLEAVASVRKTDSTFSPQSSTSERSTMLNRWHHAVSCTRKFSKLTTLE